MPRYVYSCGTCGGCFQVWHGMKETQESCQLCPETTHLTRIPQMPSIKRKEAEKIKIGSVAREYIEQNQELLKEMKEEARNQTYDD